MGGVAAAPWLLPRVATAPGVYEARKSLGWATFIFGVVMLTVSAVAVFMRDAVMDVVLAGGDGAVAPPWLEQLIQLGFVEVDALGAPRHDERRRQARRGALLAADRDRHAGGVLLPDACGALAAALAAASATAIALGNVLAEDVVSGLSWSPPGRWWLTIGRVAIAAASAAPAAGPDRSVAAPAVPSRSPARQPFRCWCCRSGETHQRLRRARRDGNRLRGDDARDHRRGLAGSGSTARSPACSGCRSPRSPQALVSLITPRRAATCSNSCATSACPAARSSMIARRAWRASRQRP